MKNSLPPKFIITVIIMLSVIYFTGSLFAQEPKAGSLVEDISGIKQEQVRKYRELGVEYHWTLKV